MRVFLHQPSQEMEHPALWDRMELDEATRDRLTTKDKLTLLERLEMHETTNPSLLERLDINNTSTPALLQRMEITETTDSIYEETISPGEMTKVPELTRSTNQIKEVTETQRTNPLNIWTKSSIASDATRSRNSRRSPTSYQSSTSIHQGPNEPRTQLLSITPKHSTRLKPSLLQRLNEDTTPRLDYNQATTGLTNSVDRETSTQTGRSTISYPRLVENPTNLSETTLQGTPTVTTTLTSLQTRNAESLSPKCPGITEKKKLDKAGIKTVKNHVESSNSSLATTKSFDSGSKPHERLHSDFQVQNGTTSSRDKLSTSMQCSHHCTIYPLLKRTLDAWDQLKYPLVDLNQQRRSKRAASGPALGMPASKRSNLLSLTASKNFETMENTSKVTSPPKSHPLTEKSSSTTPPFGMKLGVDRMHYSPTLTVSPDFIPQSSCLTESNQTMSSSVPSDPQQRVSRQKSATALTQSMDAGTQLMIADSNTLVNDANAWATERNIAMSRKDLAHELRPKYLRYNIWDGASHFSRSSADWTETASPLPTIPASELANPIATKTITENPHLFDIVTPIFVD
jgi:hypothetical protein